MSNNNYNSNDKILQDVKNGKVIDWRGKKLESLELASSYKRLGSNKYYRVQDCSNFLEWKYYLETGEKRLARANFCKVRLCPMCSWRRSLKVFGQVSRVMDHVEEHYNYRYIFLTLTVRNCYGEDLKDTLDLMTKAFNKMNQRKVFKQAIKGYFRSLEVNYDSDEFITRDMYYGNSKRKMKPRKKYYDKRGLGVGDRNPNFETYHPHFHIILAVDNSYFTQSKIYLSQEKWTSLWQSCLKADYTPVVDARVIRDKHDKGFGKAIAETAKYTVKSDDILIKDKRGNIDVALTDEAVRTLDYALHRKRLTAFGFVFKEVHRELNLDDAEDGRLEDSHIDESLRDDLAYVILRHQWNIGVKNYVLVEVAEPEGNER